MTAEMNKLANDPNFVVEFAMGPPVPSNLRPQSRSDGIKINHIYFDDVKRYVMKSAHVSVDDIRVFDNETGRVLFVSHHPGKNPYDSFDPLGMANTDAMFNVAGGEWESMCDVSSMEQPYESFKIRPKWMSRHGRQVIRTMNDEALLNIGKRSKLKSKSLRDQFTVSNKDDKHDIVYTCIADMVGRSILINNNEDQTVAVIAKTNKAMILSAAFGMGSESTIDIAAGVDCSTILAIVFGLKQVGKHFVNDAFGNYVTDPLTNTVTGAATDAVVDAATGDGDSGFFGGDGEDQEDFEEQFEPEEEPEEEEEYENSEDSEGDNEGPSMFSEMAQGVFQSFFGEGEE